MAGLAIVSVLIYFMLWGFYGYLNGFKQKRAELPSPLETAHDNANTLQTIQRFPQPRLQANEPADLNKFRTQQEQILNSYGWVDQQSGIAHIPIEQAIDILAAHGLPVREEQTPAGANQAQAKPSGGK
jgi:hypothetical protein